MAAYSRSLIGIGAYDRAEQLARDTHDQCVAVGDEWGQAVADWVLGILHQHRGDQDQARDVLRRAVELAERVNDISLLFRFSLDLADACAAVGDPVGEAAALRRSVGASLTAVETLQEGLGQALEQRKVAVQAQRLAVAAQEAAARDPLTGLTNRLGLERTAPFLLDSTATKGRIPWLVLLDVDGFKGVNDDAGHAAGDAVLREIAQLLRRECRIDDLVARWAGDEFVVLLGDTGNDYDIGPAVAERIRKSVDQHDWSGLLGPMIRPPTVSVGVAAGPAKLDTLFKAADAALYRAKRLGRNRVEVEPTARS